SLCPSYTSPRDLHSFPTRRSSDLRRAGLLMLDAIYFYDVVLAVHIAAIVVAFGVVFAYPVVGVFVTREHARFLPVLHLAQERVRSEEHTSELQSRGHLVCRLLLEK